jgi:pSer/pThr/pTyr-binding forkhead associated (FHA) protein
VQLERADDLDTGLYRVRSRIEAAEPPQQQAPPAYQQPPYGGRQAQAWQPPQVPPMPAAPPPAVPPPTAPAFPAVQPPAPYQQPTQDNVRPFPGTPGAAAGGRRWLEVNGQPHQLDRPVVVLGRSTDADIRIDDPGVSRRHAEIRTGTPSMVLDLGSTNGIVVDGQHTQRATLRDGSRIVVGSTTIVYRQTEG